MPSSGINFVYLSGGDITIGKLLTSVYETRLGGSSSRAAPIMRLLIDGVFEIDHAYKVADVLSSNERVSVDLEDKSGDTREDFKVI